VNISCTIEPVTNGKKLPKQYFMFLIMAVLLVLNGFRNRHDLKKDQKKESQE